MSAVTHVITHSLDVFLRKHFVRLRCKLTHSSLLSIRFRFSPKICKPNRRIKYLTPVKYRAKPARTMRLRPLTNSSRHAEFILVSHNIYVYIHRASPFYLHLFPCQNTDHDINREQPVCRIGYSL